MSREPDKGGVSQRCRALCALLALAALLLASPAFAAWPAYDDNADGTVTDTLTGLTWDRCAQGQSGGDCSTGAASQHAWPQALGLAASASIANYKGYNDWRLPSRNELESLVDLARTGPAIDVDAFPATPGVNFWSSTTDAADPDRAFRVDFYDGAPAASIKTDTHSVRLVRGGYTHTGYDRLGGIVSLALSDVGATATPTAATFSATANDDATGYWIAVAKDSAAPTAEEVEAGVSYGAVAVLAAGHGAMGDGVAASFTIAALVPGSAYDLWLVANGGDGRRSPLSSVRIVTPQAFTANGDGTMTDMSNGLIWDKCSWGQSGDGCATGAASQHDWAQALVDAASANAAIYKGYSDWRLPSRKELEALVNLARTAPAIDVVAFPNTPGGNFWSSTTDAADPAKAGYVSFGDGESASGAKTGTYSVRLVRGGISPAEFDWVTPPDLTAPALSSVGVSATTDTATTLSVTSDEAATGYWIAVARDATAPVPAEVKAGVAYPGAAIVASGSGAMTATIAKTFGVSGLMAATDYDLYLVAEDASANLSAPPALVQFATAAAPVNGICGSDSGLTLTVTPVNLCAAGSPGAVTGGTASYDWSCGGSNGGGNASCSATRNYVVSASVSGGNGAISAGQNVAYNATASFTVTADPGYGIQSVSGCGGALSGNTYTTAPVTAACSVTASFAASVDGVCGSANGVAVSSAPSSNLCTAGSPSAVAGSGPWAWNCNGSYGGSNASCSAPLAALDQTISFGAAPSVVVGGSGTVSATATSGLPATFTSTTTGVCTVSGNTVTGIAAGTCTIAANQTGNANYNAAPQVTQNIAVTAAPVNVDGICGSANGVAVGSAPATNLCAAGSASAVAGSGPWTWSCNGGSNASCSAPLAALDQTISFGAAPSVLVGGTGTVSATATSGLPVTFTSTTTGICTVSGNTVTGIAAGACTIAANQTGNANYNPAPQVTQSITLIVTVIDGACGSANGVVTAFRPGINLCASGNSSAVAAGSPWSWSCNGSGGGTEANCSAPNGGGRVDVSGGTWAVDLALSAGFTPASGHPKSPPNLPQGVSFPHGLLDFTLNAGASGSTATISITYSAALPVGSVYWKFGPSPDGYNCSGDACAMPHWYQMPPAQAVFAGNAVTLTITDGGVGDDDLAANGVIVDQGGPGVGAGGGAGAGAASIPTLSEWALLALAGLMGLFGMGAMRRRPVL